MRNRILIGLVTGAVLVAGASAGALASRPKAPITGPQTLRFTLVQTSIGMLDIDPPGTSTGDQVTTNNRLRRNGENVGRVGSTCSMTVPQLICVGVVRLPRGQIVVTGQLRKNVLTGSSDGYRLAVTGGTGAYQHVHGTVLIEPLPSGNQRMTLSLSP